MMDNKVRKKLLNINKQSTKKVDRSKFDWLDLLFIILSSLIPFARIVSGHTRVGICRLISLFIFTFHLGVFLSFKYLFIC